MFTFSADGQYILTNDNGSIKKYDFSTGQLVESLTLNSGGQNGIANTGNFLLTTSGVNSNSISAHDEQGNYIGDIVFPIEVNSNFGVHLMLMDYTLQIQAVHFGLYGILTMV